MASMMIRHKVVSYNLWRPHFDAHRPSREGAGVTNARVYRGVEDANDVVVVADVADPEAVKAWASGSDLRAAMENAGVVGAPLVMFGA